MTDTFAGKQLKQAREMSSMTQTQLADAVGLSYQQIQKYENGKNKMSVQRVQQFADILNVPVSYFFPVSDGDFQENIDSLLTDIRLMQRAFKQIEKIAKDIMSA